MPHRAGFASFDPAVDDSSDTEACQANNLAQYISSIVNTIKLLDVSKLRKELKIRLRAAEQVGCITQTDVLPTNSVALY